MTDTPSARLRVRWLDALLPLVPLDGWTDMAARRAAREAGLTDGEKALAAPGGVSDLVDAFFDDAEETAKAALADTDLAPLKVRERVAAGVRAWLDALEPNREAARRAAARGALPWGAPAALQRTWSVADMVWAGIGDASEDYNKYTKRGILAAIIPPITLYWLNEDDPAKVDAFIARRIETAMKVGQTGGRFLRPIIEAASRPRRA
ncbi:MAG: COQ9 family protein [Pseudomonadota bacterium]